MFSKRRIRAVRELEFLPEDYLRARFQRQVRFIRSWLLLAMGLAMILWSLQVGAWVRGAQAELLSLHGTDSAVDGDVVKVKRLRAEAEAYNRRLDALQAVKPHVTPTRVLIALADRLPEGVVLDDITMEYPENIQPDHATLRMRGVAENEAKVMDTLAAMEMAPLPSSAGDEAGVGGQSRLERAVLVESKARGAGEGQRRSFLIEVSVNGTRAVQSSKSIVQSGQPATSAAADLEPARPADGP
jgi:Tfp pilus assembly protein PilN